MFKIGTILALLSISVFASEHGGDTDIVQRTFNFVVFAGIVYYLVAEPLKSFLTGRTLSIENEIKQNATKIAEVQQHKEEAEKKLAQAKRQAGIIISDAKKEATIISDKMVKMAEQDIVMLGKQQSDLESLAESKMVKSVVDEVIKDIIKNSNIGLDQDSLTKTLLTKVS